MFDSKCLIQRAIVGLLVGWAFLFVWSGLPVLAVSSATPWRTELNFQDLIFGSTTTNQVRIIMGREPDDIVRSEQLYPVIENHYFYEEGGTGAASVFVFENGFLAGLHYKSANNQYMDLTYLLPSLGDRQMNARFFGSGYSSYYPYFPLYGF